MIDMKSINKPKSCFTCSFLNGLNLFGAGITNSKFLSDIDKLIKLKIISDDCSPLDRVKLAKFYGFKIIEGDKHVNFSTKNDLDLQGLGFHFSTVWVMNSADSMHAFTYGNKLLIDAGYHKDNYISDDLFVGRKLEDGNILFSNNFAGSKRKVTGSRWFSLDAI